MSRVVTSLLSLALLFAPRPAFAQEANLRTFLTAHCIDCHGPEVQRSRLRLDTLAADFADPKTAAVWIKVHDKLASGAMPPKSQPRPPKAELGAAIRGLHDRLHAASLERQRKEGRVVLRRLNGTEYENTLRDLLDINISLKKLLPADNTAAGFDNVSAALEVSAAHLLLYQEAAEKAVRATIPPMPLMPIRDRRTGKKITEVVSMWREEIGRSCLLRGDSLVQMARLPDHYLMVATRYAPQTGRYKIRLSAYAEGTDDKPLAIAIMGRPIGDPIARDAQVLRDVMPAKAPEAAEGSRGNLYEAELEITRETFVWVHAWGLQDRYQLSQRKEKKPLAEYAGPRLVIEWLELEGPIGPWPPESYNRLFAGVPLQAESVVRLEALGRKPPKIDYSKRPESFWASSVFRQMFIQGSPQEVEREVRRLRDGRSILDELRVQARALSETLGAADRHRLDLFLTSIREAEQRLVQDEAWVHRPKPRVTAPMPTNDVYSQGQLIARSRQGYDLVRLALQTDSTRVISLSLDSQEQPVIPGVTLGHHDASHHGQDPTKIEQLAMIEEAELRVFNHFLTRLKETTEGNETLLDRTMVLYVSNLGNGSGHSSANLPIILAGGGLRHQGHVAYDRRNNRPFSNLFVRMMRQMGIEANSFGSSTGVLSEV